MLTEILINNCTVILHFLLYLMLFNLFIFNHKTLVHSKNILQKALNISLVKHVPIYCNCIVNFRR